MSKINLSRPRFSSHRKSRLVNLRIFETKDSYSIYIWNKNYDIYGFQFYILNAEILSSCSGKGGLSSQLGFAISVMSNGTVYGIGNSRMINDKRSYLHLPRHSTVDNSDKSQSKFTLLTEIDKKNIKLKDGKRKLCITDAKILVKDSHNNFMKIQARGDCGIVGVDHKTPLKTPTISIDRMKSAYNKRNGNK